MSSNNAKLIRQRIRSVASTAKMTKAMQMIAAVNMKHAVDYKVAARPYAYSAWQILGRLVATKAEDVMSNLYLAKRGEAKNLIVLITSNRGLCGSFHANLEKKLLAILAANQDKDYSVIVVGKKGEQIANRLHLPIVAAFTDFERHISSGARTSIFRVIKEEYLEARADRVFLLYTDHVNTMTQIPRFRQVLPFSLVDLQDILEEIAKKESRDYQENEQIDYLLEPGEPQVLFETMVALVIRANIHHALLESKASSEAARMLAMQNASEAAGEMVGDLTLAYNQVRQEKITNEIAEIAASKAALE